MNRLHKKGYISDPRSREKSVALLGDAGRRSAELLEKHFGKNNKVVPVGLELKRETSVATTSIGFLLE